MGWLSATLKVGVSSVSSFSRALAFVWRSPNLVSWDGLITMIGLWIVVLLGLMQQGLPGWIGWVAMVGVPALAIWRKKASWDLAILYAPAEHRGVEAGAISIEVAVRNETGRTINDVSLRVKRLELPDGTESQPFRGQRFGLAGTGDLPYVPPDETTTLHSGDEAQFRVARVATRETGTHALWAARYIPRFNGPRVVGSGAQFAGYNREPSPNLPQRGRYHLTIEAQGENARSQSETFAFWGTEDRAVFTRLARRKSAAVRPASPGGTD